MTVCYDDLACPGAGASLGRRRAPQQQTTAPARKPVDPPTAKSAAPGQRPAIWRSPPGKAGPKAIPTRSK
eukprot:589093-Pyramimonas_sp.AAC.1